MDREKVKKGLEIILNGCDEIQCEDCCFHIKKPTKPRRCGMIEEQIQEGALALLKEQEAVEPKKTAYQRVDHTIACRYRCGTCDMSIFPSYKYCPFCGQAVKWE